MTSHSRGVGKDSPDREGCIQFVATALSGRISGARHRCADYLSSCTGRLRDAVERVNDPEFDTDDGCCLTAAARIVAVSRPVIGGCRRLVCRPLADACVPCWPGTARLREQLSFWLSVIAEFVGTFFLVLIGCGSSTEQASYTTLQQQQQDRAVRVALAFGVTYMSSVYCLRRGSEGHFNPIVTVALTVMRRLSIGRCATLVGAQFLGAVSGAAVLRAVTPADAGGLLGCSVPGDGVGQLRGLVVELVGSMAFVFVVCSVLIGAGDDCRASVVSTEGSESGVSRQVAAPFATGATLTGLSLFAVPYTGASFNTARSFGPAIIANVWNAHWIYWFGPFLGGVAGGKLYDVVFINSSTALLAMKTKIGRLAKRFARQPGDPAAAARPEEETSRDPWLTPVTDDRGTWQHSSLYRSRSVLVDRAVQSELTTRDVAENCLAVTAIAVDHHPECGEPAPVITYCEQNDDKVVDESPIGTLHRSDSYRHAVTLDDNIETLPTDLEQPCPHLTASGVADDSHRSTLDTVSELEEPQLSKDNDFLPQETPIDEVEVARSRQASSEQIQNCEEDRDGTDASPTRADVLDDLSKDLEVEVEGEPPAVSQVESTHSLTTSEEDNFTVYDTHVVDDSALVGAASSDLEQEDAVWISRQAVNKSESADYVVSELEYGEDLTVGPDQFSDGKINVVDPASPPPPPPIDVIAVDLTGRPLLPDDAITDDIQEELNNIDGEYCHSPLGGAMPESEDSSVGEFVFP